MSIAEFEKNLAAATRHPTDVVLVPLHLFLGLRRSIRFFLSLAPLLSMSDIGRLCETTSLRGIRWYCNVGIV